MFYVFTNESVSPVCTDALAAFGDMGAWVVSRESLAVRQAAPTPAL